MLVAIPKEANATLERLYREDAAQRAAGLPPSQRTRNIDRDSGRFISMLARAMKSRSILEVGSSNGVSTIWFALAAAETGGTVTGTELIPDRAAEANRNLAEAGLGDVAKVIPGDARQTLATLTGPFDLIFIDAEKEDYPGHFEAALPLVRSGGVILSDNVVSHDLSAYQAMLRERDDVDTVTLPIERGIEFTVKR
jgi:caffeoyl-CoA O-methyltransferase